MTARFPPPERFVSGAGEVELIEPPCANCVHRQSLLTCAAFPQRIPIIILIGENNHREPFPGDHGIQFEPLPRQPTGPPELRSG